MEFRLRLSLTVCHDPVAVESDKQHLPTLVYECATLLINLHAWDGVLVPNSQSLEAAMYQGSSPPPPDGILSKEPDQNQTLLPTLSVISSSHSSSHTSSSHVTFSLPRYLPDPSALFCCCRRRFRCANDKIKFFPQDAKKLGRCVGNIKRANDRAILASLAAVSR